MGSLQRHCLCHTGPSSSTRKQLLTSTRLPILSHEFTFAATLLAQMAVDDLVEQYIDPRLPPSTWRLTVPWTGSGGPHEHLTEAQLDQVWRPDIHDTVTTFPLCVIDCICESVGAGGAVDRQRRRARTPTHSWTRYADGGLGTKRSRCFHCSLLVACSYLALKPFDTAIGKVQLRPVHLLKSGACLQTTAAAEAELDAAAAALRTLDTASDAQLPKSAATGAVGMLQGGIVARSLAAYDRKVGLATVTDTELKEYCLHCSALLCPMSRRKWCWRQWIRCTQSSMPPMGRQTSCPRF